MSHVRIHNNSELTTSPKKSPGPQVHAHFFPQHSQDDVTDAISGLGQTDDNDQPRRMYVREQFTHENTVRGNVAEPSDNLSRR